MDSADPRQILARRLRALREEHWPGMKITQPQLAQALGGSRPLSVPLISSWESQSNPKIPPLTRLEAYAALFATPRSFDGDVPRLISPPDLTDEERLAMDELKQELKLLRNGAMEAGHSAGSRTAAPLATDRPIGIGESLDIWPWRYRDGNTITIACAQWPPDMLVKIPYTDINDPDYIELLTFSELDSLVELHGHLRAANPRNQVHFRRADRLTTDDYSSHLVSLGGIDWNQATTSMLRGLGLPVRQIANWEVPGGQFFEVHEDGRTIQHRPVLEEVNGKETLQEDVALFARAVSPFNQKRTVTVCGGMYGRGTYGVVRALTDVRFRDRNAEYLDSQFRQSDSFCLLTRVQIVNGRTITPDWTINDNRLFEWSAGLDA